MSFKFKKISSNNILESENRYFITTAEKTSLNTSLQESDIGVTILGYSSKLDRANTLIGDILSTNSTQIVTNKTINGDFNSITNLKLSMFADGVVSTDIHLGDSNFVIPTQKAIKSYIDTYGSGSAGSLVPGVIIYKGKFDASGTAFPLNALQGWYYIVETAGTVAGKYFDVGDTIFAIVDDPEPQVYEDNWFLIDNTPITYWANILDTTASVEQINYLNTATGDIQDQLNSKINVSAIDTNILLGTDDDKIPTQKAVKEYVDNVINETKVSPALNVVINIATLPENVKFVSSVYVENIGMLRDGFSHISGSNIVTFYSNELDGNNVFITYTV